MPSLVILTSRSCRREDGSKPVANAYTSLRRSSAALSPITPSFDHAHNYQDILPLRSPTMVRPSSIVSEDGTSFFDLQPLSSRTDSEASKWLSQFGTPTTSPEFQRRPRYERTRTSNSHINLPSLSHTPNSPTSPGSSYSSTRPLPYRTKSNTSTAPRSIDLVMPYTTTTGLNVTNNQMSTSMTSSASTVTTSAALEDELHHDKKPFGGSPGVGSLKQLFSHDAMKAPPRRPSGRKS